MADLLIAIDTQAAEWLVGDIRSFAESVLSVVPSAFAAYVRVFHPAYRRTDGERQPVRWAEIAAATGTQPHAGMQLNAISLVKNSNRALPGVYDHPPQLGALPEEVARPLANLLGAELRIFAAGHFLPLDVPEPVSAALCAFLAKTVA